jgi:adenosylcobinamide amidohydrolase
MKLAQFYDGVEIHREEKIIICRFLVLHRVLSTCRGQQGGIHDDLAYLYNHQSCESNGHLTKMHDVAVQDPDAYLRGVGERYGLPVDGCATLETAANMNNAAIARAAFRDREVIAICTGGVGTNAGRAGDPASYYQTEGRFVRIGQEGTEHAGTINTMLLISHEVTPGAMVKAAITATEAKAAALQELAVPSRYSDGLATGTGTDQIGVACRLGTGAPLTDTGKHSKVGELIGRTVHDAIKETLAIQNGLTPMRQRSVLAHIERFGADRKAMSTGVGAFLSGEDAVLFERNFACIDQDPLTVAAVAALVHLRDKFVWEILPQSCLPEVLSGYAAEVAAAVAGKYGRLGAYRDRLEQEIPTLDNSGFLRLIYRAVALGFCEKWE